MEEPGEFWGTEERRRFDDPVVPSPPGLPPLARLPDLERFGAEHGIRIVAVADIIRWRLRNETLVRVEVDAPVRVPGHGEFQCRVYREVTGTGLHMALSRGEINNGSRFISRESQPETPWVAEIWSLT